MVFYPYENRSSELQIQREVLIRIRLNNKDFFEIRSFHDLIFHILGREAPLH